MWIDGGLVVTEQAFGTMHTQVDTTDVLQPQVGKWRGDNEYSAVLSLISWIKMSVASGIPLLKRFAVGIADKFNGIMNGIRYGINSARIESANAAIKRIMSRSCDLGDVTYLFNKLRQSFFLRHPFLMLKLLPLCQQI